MRWPSGAVEEDRNASDLSADDRDRQDARRAAFRRARAAEDLRRTLPRCGLDARAPRVLRGTRRTARCASAFACRSSIAGAPSSSLMRRTHCDATLTARCRAAQTGAGMRQSAHLQAPEKGCATWCAFDARMSDDYGLARADRRDRRALGASSGPATSPACNNMSAAMCGHLSTRASKPTRVATSISSKERQDADNHARNATSGKKLRSQARVQAFPARRGSQSHRATII